MTQRTKRSKCARIDGKYVKRAVADDRIRIIDRMLEWYRGRVPVNMHPTEVVTLWEAKEAEAKAKREEARRKRAEAEEAEAAAAEAEQNAAGDPDPDPDDLEAEAIAAAIRAEVAAEDSEPELGETAEPELGETAEGDSATIETLENEAIARRLERTVEKMQELVDERGTLAERSKRARIDGEYVQALRRRRADRRHRPAAGMVPRAGAGRHAPGGGREALGREGGLCRGEARGGTEEARGGGCR